MARLMVDRDKLIKAFYLQCLLPEGGFFERDDFSFSRIKEIILTAVPAEIVREQSDAINPLDEVKEALNNE